jgi:hypothetical protein
VQDNGPSTISGRVDFSASNTNQFSDNNGANQGPTSVNDNVADVTDALNAVNSLSSALGADAGTNLAISGNTTVNESAGKLVTVGGITYRVFCGYVLQLGRWEDADHPWGRPRRPGGIQFFIQ